MRRRMLSAVAALALLGSLLLAAQVWAISSTNYRLDWFTPLTSGGGGPAASTNYKANFTIGQSVIGKLDSANYRAGLGYWYGMDLNTLYLPLLER